jgi:hypothetical protein
MLLLYRFRVTSSNIPIKKKDITPPCMLFPWQILSFLIIFFSLSRPALDYAIDTFIINGSDFGFYNIVSILYIICIWYDSHSYASGSR